MIAKYDYIGLNYDLIIEIRFIISLFELKSQSVYLKITTNSVQKIKGNFNDDNNIVKFYDYCFVFALQYDLFFQAFERI